MYSPIPLAAHLHAAETLTLHFMPRSETDPIPLTLAGRLGKSLLLCGHLIFDMLVFSSSKVLCCLYIVLVLLQMLMSSQILAFWVAVSSPKRSSNSLLS